MKEVHSNRTCEERITGVILCKFEDSRLVTIFRYLPHNSIFPISNIEWIVIIKLFKGIGLKGAVKILYLFDDNYYSIGCF